MDENARNGGRLTPEQWENIRQGTATRAHAARAKVLRDVFGRIRASVRTLARGGWKTARVLADRLVPGSWWNAYVAWRERSAAIKELAGLDDRTLKDMGLHRSEIESVIYESSRRSAERRRAAVGRRTASTRPGTKPSRVIDRTAA